VNLVNGRSDELTKWTIAYSTIRLTIPLIIRPTIVLTTDYSGLEKMGETIRASEQRFYCGPTRVSRSESFVGGR